MTLIGIACGTGCGKPSDVKKIAKPVPPHPVAAFSTASY